MEEMWGMLFWNPEGREGVPMKVDLERGISRGVSAAVGLLVLRAVSEHVPLVWAAVSEIKKGPEKKVLALVPAETTHEDGEADTSILRKYTAREGLDCLLTADWTRGIGWRDWVEESVRA